MRAAIDAVRATMAAGDSAVLGIHLEGPLLSPARPGVHDAAKFREPDAALLDLVASLRSGRAKSRCSLSRYMRGEYPLPSPPRKGEGTRPLRVACIFTQSNSLARLHSAHPTGVGFLTPHEAAFGRAK